MAGTSSKIPIEITSDKETVSIEAALAFAASSPVTPAAVPAIHSPISDSRKAKSIQSISDKAKRSLFVTDVTKTEWCDKQMEFSLFAEEWCSQTQTDMALVYGGGGRRNNDAMQADIDRHIKQIMFGFKSFHWSIRLFSVPLEVMIMLTNLASVWFMALFISIILTDVLELRWSGVTIEDRWRNEQLWVIGGVSAHLLMCFNVSLKFLLE